MANYACGTILSLRYLSGLLREVVLCLTCLPLNSSCVKMFLLLTPLRPLGVINFLYWQVLVGLVGMASLLLCFVPVLCYCIFTAWDVCLSTEILLLIPVRRVCE